MQIFVTNLKKNSLTLLKWDRDIHEGNFPLYFSCGVVVSCPYNYARAVAVHTDMLTIPDRHTVIYDEFCKGNFTVKTSNPPFSNMSQEESHEQNNDCVDE